MIKILDDFIKWLNCSFAFSRPFLFLSEIDRNSIIFRRFPTHDMYENYSYWVSTPTKKYKYTFAFTCMFLSTGWSFKFKLSHPRYQLQAADLNQCSKFFSKREAYNPTTLNWSHAQTFLTIVMFFFRRHLYVLLETIAALFLYSLHSHVFYSKYLICIFSLFPFIFPFFMFFTRCRSLTLSRRCHTWSLVRTFRSDRPLESLPKFLKRFFKKNSEELMFYCKTNFISKYDTDE